MCIRDRLDDDELAALSCCHGIPLVLSGTACSGFVAARTRCVRHGSGPRARQRTRVAFARLRGRDQSMSHPGHTHRPFTHGPWPQGADAELGRDGILDRVTDPLRTAAAVGTDPVRRLYGLGSVVDHVRTSLRAKAALGLAGLSALVAIVGSQHWHAVFTAAAIALAANVVLATSTVKLRIFGLFQAPLAVFLLGRPAVVWAKGLTPTFNPQQMTQALLLLTPAFLALFVGALAGTAERREVIGRHRADTTAWREGLRVASLAAFLTLSVVNLGLGLDALLTAPRGSYVDSYLQNPFAQRFPVGTLLGSLAPLAAVSYLMTRPGRRSSLIALGILLAQAMPQVFLGRRSALVNIAFFAVCYLVLREGESRSWRTLSLRTRRAIGVGAVTLAVAGSLVLNNVELLRASAKATPQWDPSVAITRLLFTQGITMDYLSLGVARAHLFPDPYYGSYTIGPVLDQWTSGAIGRALTGNPQPIPQSAEFAKRGSSSAATLSYIVLGKERFEAGSGTGSSFILDGYLDGRVWGVMLLSLLLGLFLGRICIWASGSPLTRFLTWGCMLGMLSVPRSPLTAGLSSVISYQSLLLAGGLAAFASWWARSKRRLPNRATHWIS